MRRTVPISLLAVTMVALATPLSACSGCSDRSEWSYTESDAGDAAVRDTLPDTTEPGPDARRDALDGSMSDATDTAGTTNRPDIPERLGPPCWLMGGPDLRRTGQSPCRGPSQAAGVETVFDRTFDTPDGGTIWWNMLRVGPEGVMYYAFGRDAPAPRVVRYDPQSGKSNEFDVARGTRHLHDMAVTSNGLTVTLESEERSDGSTAVDARWYTPDGTIVKTQRLPPPSNPADRPTILTDGDRIWAVLVTESQKTRVFQLAYEDNQPPKAQWITDFPALYAIDGAFKAGVSRRPVGADSELRVEIQRPFGTQTVSLANLGLELDRPLDDPSTRYTRPLLTDEHLAVMVGDARRAPYEWVCRLPRSNPTSGRCIPIGERVDAQLRLDTLMVDAQLVGLHKRSIDFGSAPLSAPTNRRPWMDVAHQDVVQMAADRRGRIYLLSRADRTANGSHELSVWSPDGQEHWNRTLDLPRPIRSMSVGDESLYVVHFAINNDRLVRKVLRIGD